MEGIIGDERPRRKDLRGWGNRLGRDELMNPQSGTVYQHTPRNIFPIMRFDLNGAL